MVWRPDVSVSLARHIKTSPKLDHHSAPANSQGHEWATSQAFRCTCWSPDRDPALQEEQCDGEITISVISVCEGHQVRLCFSHGAGAGPAGKASAWNINLVGRELERSDGEA